MTGIFSVRRIVLVVALLGVLGFLFDTNRLKPTAAESALLDVIEQIEYAQPIGSRSKFTMLPCSKDYYRYSKACTAQGVRMKNLKIEEVDFHPQDLGSIIELNEVGPGCIRLALIEKKFSGGKIDSQCSHTRCYYYGISRPWGRLSFRLPDDPEDAQCVRNVVFNTEHR